MLLPNLRAYTISPFIFLGILLVSSVLSLHFMQIDREIASSISQESRAVASFTMNEADILNFRAYALTMAYQTAAKAPDKAALEGALLGNLTEKFNVSEVSVVQSPEGFRLLVNATLLKEIRATSSVASGTFNISVDYPFFTAKAYADAFDTSPIDCGDLESGIKTRVVALGLTSDWAPGYSHILDASKVTITLYLRNDKFMPMTVEKYGYVRTYEVPCQ